MLNRSKSKIYEKIVCFVFFFLCQHSILSFGACCVPKNTAKCYHVECVVVCHFYSHYRLVVRRRDPLELLSAPDFIYVYSVRKRKEGNIAIVYTRHMYVRVMISSVIFFFFFLVRWHWRS